MKTRDQLSIHNLQLTTHNFFSLLVFCYMTLSIPGCGYHLAGTGPELPPEAKSIAVPTLKNHTFEPALETIITKHIREELLTNSRLQLTHSASEADLLLNGAIKNFNLIPISFDRDRNVVIEYRVKIIVDVRLEDASSRTVLWEDAFLETTSEFLVQGDTSKTRVAQNRAIEEASKHLAEDLINRVLEGQRR